MSGLSREEAKHHVVIYVRVFAALLALTAVTVGISYLRLPLPQAVTLALAIAAFKVSLVAAFFMHLAGEKKIIFSVLALAVFFFAVLLVCPALHSF